MNRRLLFILCILLQIGFLCVMIRSNALILSTGTKILLETAPIDPHDLFRGEYARLRYRISSVEVPDSVLERGDPVYVTLVQKGKFWGVESADTKKPDGELKGKVVIRGTVQRVHPEHITVLKDFSDLTESGWLAKNPDSVRAVERIETWQRDWKAGDIVYVPFTQEKNGSWSSLPWWIDKDKKDALERKFRADKEKRVLISATVSSVEFKNLAEVEYGIESYYVPEGKSRELERPRGGGKVTVEAAVDKSGDSAINRVFIDGTLIDF